MATDVHGEPVLGESRDQRCAVLKVFGNDRPVTDGIRNTPDYPTLSDPVADVVLLLRMTTTANVADMIEVEGFKLKVIGVQRATIAVAS